MEGPILFWGYKEQESNLILPEHDDDDDDDDDDDNICHGMLKEYLRWISSHANHEKNKNTREQRYLFINSVM